MHLQTVSNSNINKNNMYHSDVTMTDIYGLRLRGTM